MGILALGIGLGGAGGVRRHAPRGQPLARPRRCSSCWPATSWQPTAPRTSSRCAACCRRCRSPAPLWVAGFLAITGSPPFGLFVSELVDPQGRAATGARSWVAIGYLLLLGIVIRRHGAHRPAHGLGQPRGRSRSSRTAFAAAGRSWPPLALGAARAGPRALPARLAAVGPGRGRARGGGPLMRTRRFRFTTADPCAWRTARSLALDAFARGSDRRACRPARVWPRSSRVTLAERRACTCWRSRPTPTRESCGCSPRPVEDAYPSLTPAARRPTGSSARSPSSLGDHARRATPG